MRQALFAAGMAAALIAAPATAQISDQQITARTSPEYGRCIDRDSSTAGMRECAAAEYEIQDRALNARYQALMRELNPRQQEKLRAAQRAWIAYRDARCASMADQDWGTLSLITASDCRVTMTIARLIDLEDYPPG